MALARAAGPDLKEIGCQVEQGESECWRVLGRGYIVSRLEVTEQGKELVIVAAQGRNGLPVLDAFERIGKANGAESVRIHSERPGMGRYLKSKGYKKIGSGAGLEVIYGRQI